MVDTGVQAEQVDVSKLFHVIYSKTASTEDRNLAAELAIPELVQSVNGARLVSIIKNDDLGIAVRVQAIEAIVANPDFINGKLWAKGKFYEGQDMMFSHGIETVKEIARDSLTLGSDGFMNHMIYTDNWAQMKNEGARINPDIAKKHIELVGSLFLQSDALKNDKKLCLSILKNKYGSPLFGAVLLNGSADKFNSSYMHLYTSGGSEYKELWRTFVSATTPVANPPREEHKPLQISIPEGKFTITTREVGEYSLVYHYDLHAQVSNRFSLTPEQYQKLENNEQVAITGKDGEQYLLVKGYTEIRHNTYPCCRIYRNSTLLPKDVENAAADTFIDGKDSHGYSAETEKLLRFASTGIFDVAYRERAGLKGLEWTYEGEVIASQNYPPKTLELARQKIAHFHKEVVNPSQVKYLETCKQPAGWGKILETSKADYHEALSNLKELSDIHFNAHQPDNIRTEARKLLEVLFKAVIDDFVVKGEEHLISLFSDKEWLKVKLPPELHSYANLEMREQSAINFLNKYKDITEFPKESDHVYCTMDGLANSNKEYYSHLSPQTKNMAKTVFDAIIARQQNKANEENMAAITELRKLADKRQTVVALGANQPREIKTGISVQPGNKIKGTP